ncbi:twin-arginine translocase TatA/TatE family subunit [Streptococcus loxodontisalivarius]|uniref:Sec-independent protein translocase protein TatA n=1 Tax=Streptococcus loxodontisalivarius TaxID=1349415 RepID=A0ABS2PQQ1_9STRE|nr:twin-arginine translocase TatA/TatE family subunit [Streptococcus loxodontisalivarius]MBM7641824.1 sec-independent protein translocase protein TatA [Streptococcus loxodontisalivarius]
MGFLRDIGLPGLLVIVVAALLIFGPQKLPEVGSSLGKMITEFKKALYGESDKDDKKSDKE